MTQVTVVMSTYNGEAFLREQLDSILAQEGVNVKLYVRDDGSRDGTVQMLEQYDDQYDNFVFWNRGRVENLGIKHSFLGLLHDALCAEPDCAYFAFADQDDFWQPDKLAAGVAMLQTVENTGDARALYYSNKTFVDVQLKLISQEHIRYYGDFLEACYGCLASGCTMVMSRALAQTATEAIPEIDCIHDAWVYRLAKATGARIVFDEKSHILYRQHGNNVCGVDACVPSLNRWQNLFRRREHPIQRFMQEISLLHGNLLAGEEKKYVENLCAYNHSLKATLALACSPLAKKRGWKTRCLWIAKVVFRTL